MPEITKHSDREFEPFVVDDGTGAAYVDPESAELMLESGDEFTVEGGEEPPAFVREFVEHETSIDPVGEHKRWYREFRLDVDEEARVAGEADPDAVALEESVTTAVVAAGDAPKFFVADDADLDLGQRMRQEALIYFVIAGTLFAFSYMFVVMG
jgi:hypothetical protein